MSSTVETPVEDHPLLNKRQELVVKVLLVLSGPVLLIVLLEGVAFVWEIGQANGPYAWELVASRRIELVKYEQPGTGYTLMAPNSSYDWQDIPVNINSNGLRGPEVSYEKKAGVYRILNLGDSVVMGWGVHEADTYGRQLETLLNEEERFGQSVEVINGGVPGWNPANELAFLQSEGLKYEPDLILLDLTLVNDIYGPGALKTNQRPALFEWLRAHTYLWPFFTIQANWMQARAAGRERIDIIDPPTEAAKYFPLDPEAERWEIVWNWITEINNVANQNGAELVLILFPLEFQVLDETFSTLPQELLMARAMEEDILTLDLLPIFRTACQQKPEGICTLEDRYLFADVWMHPSAFGNELTATALFDIVQKFEEK